MSSWTTSLGWPECSTAERGEMTEQPTTGPDATPTDSSNGAEAPSPPLDATGPGVVSDAVHQPAKVMRIATMVRQLLEEVRHSSLDEAGRSRLADIYETSVRELGDVLSADLKDELARLS